LLIPLSVFDASPCRYAFALFFAVFMDCLNFLAPRWGVPLEGKLLEDMPWPPAIMKSIFTWWVNACDPVLKGNPSWYALICGYSPFFHSFFYVAAIWALWNGKSKVPITVPIINKKFSIPLKDWALFWAGWMISGVLPVFSESLGVSGAVFPSNNKLLFLAGYHSFIVFPLLTVYRFKGETSENVYHRYQDKVSVAAPASAKKAVASPGPARARSSSRSRVPRSASKSAAGKQL
jgi:hypothetical protein